VATDASDKEAEEEVNKGIVAAVGLFSLFGHISRTYGLPAAVLGSFFLMVGVWANDTTQDELFRTLVFGQQYQERWVLFATFWTCFAYTAIAIFLNQRTAALKTAEIARLEKEKKLLQERVLEYQERLDDVMRPRK
jgi:hypothetical protein